MKNIGLITYTNSVMKDVWPAYFGQLEKHLQGINSYSFSDIDFDSNMKDHVALKYNNLDHYYRQYLGCLESVIEDYVIYAQEDFILYDDVTCESLQKYCSFLEKSDYSFVRLIRCGYKTPLDVHVESDMYEVDINTNDAFAMQATLWKKKKLRELYEYVKSEKWYEGDHWNDGCRKLGVKGVLTYNGESQRGKSHYDSIVYPYTCTAVNKGYWNINEYGTFLFKIFNEYGIDPNKRGTRISYDQFVKGMR